MDFDRWKPIRNTTFAYHVFKLHQTEINHIYWAHHAAHKGAYTLTREKTKDDSANSVFPDPKKERRREIPLGEWSKDYIAFDNWSRLAAIIAVTGYFEIFVKNIVDAACQSCPAILVGGHREFDGLKLLLAQPDYAFSQHSGACITGAWPKRIKAYKRIFGSCPEFITKHVSHLDNLRILRNSVGHAFGRKLEKATVGRSLGAQPAIKVTQQALLDSIDLINKVALEIEGHLATKYVGCYETLATYHFWDAKGIGDKQDARNFRRFMHSSVKTDADLGYFQSMINYYRSVLDIVNKEKEENANPSSTPQKNENPK